MATTAIPTSAEIADALEQAAHRMIGVASGHRDKLIREKSDPDVRLQRGNASSFSHTEGFVSGIADALRSFGHPEHADRVEDARDAMCDGIVPADAEARVEITNDYMADLEQAAGFEEWTS